MNKLLLLAANMVLFVACTQASTPEPTNPNPTTPAVTLTYPNAQGTWRDPVAIITRCGQTSTVDVAATLAATGVNGVINGTIVVVNNGGTFTGTISGRTNGDGVLAGTVELPTVLSPSSVAVDAQLMPNRIEGTASGPVDCNGVGSIARVSFIAVKQPAV